MFAKPRQTYKHCLANISDFACQACLCVWPPRQTLLDKHILLVYNFLFVISRKCLSRICFCDDQTDHHYIVLDRQSFKCLPNYFLIHLTVKTKIDDLPSKRKTGESKTKFIRRVARYTCISYALSSNYS